MTASRTATSRFAWLLLTAVFFAWAAGTQAQTKTNQAPININAAEATALETLPGIGPTLAQRIIEGRPYQSTADLEKVKGLTKSKVAALKGQIVFGPFTAAKAAKPSKSAKAADTKATADTNAVAAKAPTAKPGQAQTAPATASTKAPGKATKTGSTSKLAPGQKININTASFKELDALPGIGPTKAQAIIDYRTQQGPFKNIEDIQKVKGIKEGSFSKVKDYIKVSN